MELPWCGSRVLNFIKLFTQPFYQPNTQKDRCPGYGIKNIDSKYNTFNIYHMI